MPNKQRIAIFLLAIIVVIISVWIYFANQEINWWQKFEQDGDPYDVDVFVTLLEENTWNTNCTSLEAPFYVVEKELDTATAYTYFHVHQNISKDSADVHALHNFMQHGNAVVLASNAFYATEIFQLVYGVDSTQKLSRIHFNDNNLATYPDSIQTLHNQLKTAEEKDTLLSRFKHNLYQKTIKQFSDTVFFEQNKAKLYNKKSGLETSLFYIYKTDTIAHNWHTSAGGKLADTLLTFANNFPAAVRIKVGKGQLILATTPLLFTNYYLQDSANFAFTNTFLSQVPKGEILIDGFVPPSAYPRSSGGGYSASPLSFILSQPALQYAWHLLLALVLIFVLFGSKRKQRVIPLRKAKTNSSLAYAKMLGSLQLKAKNNSGKAEEIVHNFMFTLRQRSVLYHNKPHATLKKLLVQRLPELRREIETTFFLTSLVEQGKPISKENAILLFNSTQKICKHL